MKAFLPPIIPAGAVIRACITGALLAGAAASASAATLWSTNFASPPYTEGATVVGTEGWSALLFDSAEESDADLVNYSGATGGTALRLYSTSTNTATLRQRSRIANSFEEVSGSKVEASFSVAYDWKGASVNGSSFSFGANDASPINLYFSAANGLYVRGTYGAETDITIFSAAQMAKNSFYSFKVTFDFSTQTFDLSVNGEDVDGGPLQFDRTLSFISTAAPDLDGIAAVRLINDRGDNISMYVDQISITAIPEGRTLGMLGGAGAVVLMGSLLRRSKPAMQR